MKFIVSVFFCVHLAGCIWFLCARIEGPGPENWIVKRGILDADIGSQYLHSIYWAFTTLTTVGYGDISAYTEFEMIVAIFWMLFGAGFYSYTIGSLSSFLSTIDTRESILNEKLAAANAFVKDTGISEQCKKKIIQLIKYNTTKVGAIFSDKHSLFDELPKQLKYEVVLSMYNGIVAELPFFNKRDTAFVVFIMPRLRPVSYRDGEYIYRYGEFACEAFVISRGRVNLVDENEISYKSFLRGSLVGEVELVLKTTRLDSMQVCGETECLTMSKESFFAVLNEFPAIEREFVAIAKERAKRNAKARLELSVILKLKNQKGDLRALGGKLASIDENPETQRLTQLDSMER